MVSRIWSYIIGTQFHTYKPKFCACLHAQIALKETRACYFMLLHIPLPSWV